METLKTQVGGPRQSPALPWRATLDSRGEKQDMQAGRGPFMPLLPCLLPTQGLEPGSLGAVQGRLHSAPGTRCGPGTLSGPVSPFVKRGCWVG